MIIFKMAWWMLAMYWIACIQAVQQGTKKGLPSRRCDLSNDQCIENYDSDQCFKVPNRVQGGEDIFACGPVCDRSYSNQLCKLCPVGYVPTNITCEDPTTPQSTQSTPATAVSLTASSTTHLPVTTPPPVTTTPPPATTTNSTVESLRNQVRHWKTGFIVSVVVNVLLIIIVSMYLLLKWNWNRKKKTEGGGLELLERQQPEPPEE